MLQSIILDSLIVLVIMMIAAIGYARGGMRELCTAAGILFGNLVAGAWAPRWGSWLSARVDISAGSATFIVYVAVLAVSAIVCGYGASLAFFSRPGPGGRLYGALLGIINGIVFTSLVLDGVRRYLLDGRTPAIVAESHVARAMTDSFGWVVLGIAAFIVVATAFGFLIRENESDDALASYAPPRTAPAAAAQRAPERPASPPHSAPDMDATATIAPAEVERSPSAPPLRVREVRHWEDPVEPNPRTAFGAGWSQTWPVASPGSEVKTPWEAEEERRRLRQSPGTTGSEAERRRTSSSSGPAAPRSDTDALNDWLERERRDTREGGRES